MRRKKTVGLALIIIGAILLVFSDYIARQVAAGQARISSAQSQVDTVQSVFSHSQYTKPFGKTLTGGAQKKIDAGQQKVDQYSSISNMLKVGGIVLIIAGGYLFFFPIKRKSR